MKKILMIGSFRARSRQRYFTLKELGYDVKFISDISEGFSPNDNNKGGLIKRVFSKLGFPLDIFKANKNAIEFCKKNNSIDILWVEKCLCLRRSTLVKIKKYCPNVILVIYTEDDMFNRRNQSFYFRRCLPLYDIVFTTKSYNLNKDELPSIGARNIFFIDKAYDKNYHKPICLSEKDFKKYQSDITFIGSFEKSRADLMYFLAEEGFKINIYGNGWRKYKNKHINLSIKYRPLIDQEYIKAICASKINLNFLRKDNRDLQTDRSMEIPACGGFMLTERTIEHQYLFEENREAVFFDVNNKKELLEKCNYYLENDSERKKVALQGLKRIKNSSYSHHDRLKKMLDHINLFRLKKLKINHISFISPGIFHSFDVANALEDYGIFSKLYTQCDFLRVIKWKKNLPFNKIFFLKYPIIKFGKLRRNDSQKIFNKLISKETSKYLICMPSIALDIFKKNQKKFKILDIDHFTWDKNLCSKLISRNFKYFKPDKPLGDNKHIMQLTELNKESLLRNNKTYPYNLDHVYKEILECESADLIMTPVSYVKKSLIDSGYPENKIFLNPYGYDPKIFYPAKRKKYKKSVLYCGSISQRKGWHYLCEILKYFKNTNQQFYIIGGIENNIKSEVLKFFNENKSNIFYLGSLPQSKAAFYMRNCGISIFPSVLEGFGMTILQSMASGTPVIASNATCAIDLIAHDRNGWIIDKKDIDKWVHTIENYLINADVLHNISKIAQKSVINLTWENYVERLVDFLISNQLIK